MSLLDDVRRKLQPSNVNLPAGPDCPTCGHPVRPDHRTVSCGGRLLHYRCRTYIDATGVSL